MLKALGDARKLAESMDLVELQVSSIVSAQTAGCDADLW